MNAEVSEGTGGQPRPWRIPRPKPAARGATAAITYDDLLNALEQILDEDIRQLDALVADEDASCPARALRAERLAAAQHYRRILEVFETWDWGAPIAGRDQDAEEPAS